NRGLGWSIARNPEWVVRTILITINVVPFVIYLILLARLIDRFGQTDWGRFFVLAAAAFGTLVTPFLDTFNNHTLGTCFALFALYAGIEIWTRPEKESPGLFFLAGLCAGFTVTWELPAGSFSAALALLLGYRSPRKTLAYFLPASALPVLALA